MNRPFAIVLLLLFIAGPVVAKNRHCMFRVHTEANPQDTESFSKSVRAQVSGKDVAIERFARITESEVTAFYPYPLGKGEFGALFQLDEHGRILLDELSIEQRGKFLFIFINGRAITELFIDKRVSDGQIYIRSGLNAADIEVMKKDWRLIGGKRRR